MTNGAAGNGPRTSGSTRRAAAILIGVAVAAVTAPAVLLWPDRQQAHQPPSDGLGGGPGEGPDEGPFDETYAGRHIRGTRTAADHQHASTSWHITVDGRPLHLMRRADGGYLSMIDHYQSYPTPLIATRRAVDELGHTQELRGSTA